MPRGGTKVLITGKMSEEGLAYLRKAKGMYVEYAPGLNGSDLELAIADANALIIRTETAINRELLEHAQRLELICRAGIGVDHIDMRACAERQIIVMNTPAANRVSTAEHTMALLLAVARNVPQGTDSIRRGEWNRERYMGTEISQKTLGIIGLGNIGQRVAVRAKSFGMDVIAYDPYLDPSVANAVNVKLLPLDRVLNESDFISVHVPLTDETSNMVNDAFLNKMKRGSFFINTSRGKVVNEQSLVEALERNHLKGAALDVFVDEPVPADNPLLKLDKVVLTPHVAGQTFESQINMSMEAAAQVREFFEEGTVLNAVLKF